MLFFEQAASFSVSMYINGLQYIMNIMWPSCDWLVVPLHYNDTTAMHDISYC